MIFTTVRFKENCEYRAWYSKDQGADVKEIVSIVMVMIYIWNIMDSQEQRADGKEIVNIVDGIHENKEPM